MKPFDPENFIYPHFDVIIRKNETKEVRTRHSDLRWYEHSLFFWTEGNYGCDCNRHDEFERAANPNFDALEFHYADDPPCGHTRYTVIKAIFPDGTEQLIDEDEE